MNKKEFISSIEELHKNQKLGADLDFATSEAYNLLKTNISFSLSKKEEGGQLIGISSASPQEGKSYTSINLCYSLACDGNKVLLLDGDLRRPSIGKSLKHSEKPGLSNMLAGQVGVEAIATGILHDNMSVLFSGDVPPNPSKLIRSDEMKNLLHMLSLEYDYIIIDLPPVNSVADAIGISKMIDGMILVVKHAFTRKKDLSEAVRQLRFVDANILGIIYNGYTTGSSYYKSKKYYKYYRKSNYYYTSSEGYQNEDAEETKEVEPATESNELEKE